MKVLKKYRILIKLLSGLTILFLTIVGTVSYAQNNIVSCEIWYNNDFENRIITSISYANQHNLAELIDVSELPQGINTINIRYKQSDGKYSVPLSKSFIKLSPLPEPIINNLSEYEIWYNNDFENRIITSVSYANQHNLAELIDVSELPQGINTINIRYKQSEGKYSVPLSKSFIKLSPLPEPVSNNLTKYEIWYNNDFENRNISTISHTNQYNLVENLDVSELPEGINTINIRYEQSNGKQSVPLRKTFIKLSPLAAKHTNNKIISYKYWFDDDISNVYHTSISESYEIGVWIEELDLSQTLFGGEHSITVQFKDSVNKWSVPVSFSFFKEFYPHGTIYVNETSICQNNNIVLSILDIAIDTDSVFWDFGDGSDIIPALASDDITHQYNTAGEYEITCTFKHSESGNSTSETITIFVHPVYENLPIEEVEVCANELPYVFGSQHISENGYYEEVFQSVNACDSLAKINFTILELSYGIDEITTCGFFEWIDGNTYTESTNEPIFTLTNQAGCDSIVTLNLTIIPLPNIEVIQNEVSLTATETEANYQWLDCNNNFSPIANATSQTFTATQNGKYAVEIEKDGCSAISDCYEITTVRVFDYELSNISVYPNPNDGKFTIDLGKVYEDISYKIYDLQGRIILAESYKNTEKIYLDLILARGIYTIQIKSDESIKSMKVIID